MSNWSPWANLTKRKVIMTLALVAVLGSGLTFAIHWTVEHSEPYELGRQAVGKRLNVPVDAVKLKRFGRIDYSAGDERGSAQFVLCAVPNDCFAVIATKQQGAWKVVELREDK